MYGWSKAVPEYQDMPSNEIEYLHVRTCTHAKYKLPSFLDIFRGQLPSAPLLHMEIRQYLE